MIKIFHTGDIHLDSPLSGGDIVRSEEGRKRLRRVFSRMMEHVRTVGYDLVLIAGDLYENGYLTEESAELLKSEFDSLSCPVIISPGNHDPYERGSFYLCAELPENVRVFGEEKAEKIDIDSLGVSVYGYAFKGINHRENPIEGVYCDPERINILCAHTEVGAPLSPYAPMSYGDIEGAGFSYAALGHIHKAPQIYRSPVLTAAYCGFAEGRGFDEIGRGSALSVTLYETGDKGDIKIEKLSFSDYSYELLPINISGLTEDTELEARILKELQENGYGEKNAVRITFEGVTDCGFVPNISYLNLKCSPLADLLEIKDNSIPLSDEAELMRDMTIRGEFYRVLKDKLFSSDTNERNKASLALRIGLAALEGRELASFLPADEKNDADAPEEEI